MPTSQSRQTVRRSDKVNGQAYEQIFIRSQKEKKNSPHRPDLGKAHIQNFDVTLQCNAMITK